MTNEILMDESVRSGDASAQVHCMACDSGFTASLWQPRMCCPHCETIGYPDQAGYNLVPLTWICPTCEHHNDGVTNFCVNCGTGETARCLRCEAPVYSTACTVCGTVQMPLIERKRLAEQREQRFHPIRMRVITEQARRDPTPPANHNPTYGVAEWRSLTPQAPPEPEPIYDDEDANEQNVPTPAQAIQQKAANPPQKQKKKPRNLSNVAVGIIFVLAGLGFLFGSEIIAVMQAGGVLLVIEQAAQQVAGVIPQTDSGTVWLVVTIVLGLMLFPFALRSLNWLSRRIIP